MRRNTRQREAILRVLRSSHSHPTADAIYDEVRKTLPGISKGTVYRNLRVLQESGEISELSLGGLASRFEGRQECHYHFRCQRCGQVYDLDERVDHKLDRMIEQRTGFKVSCHHTEFRGLCRDCQLKQPGANIEEEAIH
jgi:Fur family peroxide stress response transcriptional regulator